MVTEKKTGRNKGKTQATDVEAEEVHDNSSNNETEHDDSSNFSDQGEPKSDPVQSNSSASENYTIPKPEDLKPDNTETFAGIKINWTPNNFTENIMRTKPHESKAEEPLKTDKAAVGEEEPTEEEKRQFLAGQFDQPQELMTVEELMEASSLVIDILDTINSTAVGAFAKEPSAKFELDSAKRKRLATSLAKVFFKYQVKMGPLAALIIGMLLYFGITWKQGWEIKRDKKIEAERKAIEDQRQANRKKKEDFRNRITATIGIERLTLKKIAERMGLSNETVKAELELMQNMGLIKADHSETPAVYSIAE